MFSYLYWQRVTDNNNVDWGADEMDPAKLALANAFFDNVQKGSGAIDGLVESLQVLLEQLVKILVM